MDINAITRQFFNVDFRSVCGCRFNLAGGATTTAVHIASDDTEVGRVWGPALHAVLALRDWLGLVAREFASLARRGSDGASCEAPIAFHESEDLPLTVSATLVDGQADHVRLEVTMLSDEHDSLDYCHIAVVLDLSVSEFLDEVARALATGGDLSLPA